MGFNIYNGVGQRNFKWKWTIELTRACSGAENRRVGAVRVGDYSCTISLVRQARNRSTTRTAKCQQGVEGTWWTECGVRQRDSDPIMVQVAWLTSWASSDETVVTRDRDFFYLFISNVYIYIFQYDIFFFLTYRNSELIDFFF